MFSTRTNRAGLKSSSRIKLRSKILTLCSLIACASVAFYFATSSVKSKSETRSLVTPTVESGYAVNHALALNIQKGIAHPSAMVSGDFDGDGVSDLVAAYQAGAGTL